MVPIASDTGAVRRDDALMRRIGEGDTSAFREVLVMQTRPLIKLSYGIVGQIEEAEDITQESLLTLWQIAPKWEAKATISAYLRIVVTRKSIDAVRHRKRQAGDQIWNELYDPNKNPEEELATHQAGAVVRAHLAELPERQRAAILLTHFENRSHQDAAAVMEIGLEAFSSLLARARRTLRQKIEQSQPGGDGNDRDDAIA